MDADTRRRIVDAAWRRELEVSRAELLRLRDQMNLLMRRVADLEEAFRLEPTRALEAKRR